MLCSSILLISLDQTVLNVALPTLVDSLHPSGTGLAWIVDGYTLTNAVLLLFGGALGDRYGRRRMFLVGLVIFGAGSLVSALVHSTGPLIAMRAVMGLGAALTMPATLALIAATFTGAQRAKAIGVWAGVGGIGSAAGPLLGGLLLHHFWWGSIFLINVPIAALAVLGALVLVSESRPETARPLDPVGVVLSALGLAALTYALIVAPTKHWGSATVLGALGGAVLLLAAFFRWDASREEALLDLELFKNRVFSSAVGAITATFFALFGVSFLLSQYIQFVRGVGVLGVGLRSLPLALGSLITSNLAASATRRFGLRPVLLTAMSLVTLGLAGLCVVAETTPYLVVGTAFALIGIGIGLAIAPASNAIIGTLSADKIGAGSGLRSMVQLLGGSFGVAIIGSLATGRYSSIMHTFLRQPLPGLSAADRVSVGEQIGDAAGVVPHLPAALGHTVAAAANHAYVSGLHLSALVGVAVMLAATAGAAAYIPRDAEIADGIAEPMV